MPEVLDKCRGGETSENHPKMWGAWGEQEWVYTGRLEKEKGKDILESVLQLTGAVPRYNPRILQQPGPNDKAGPETPVQLPLGTKGLRPWEAPFSELGYLHHPGTEDSIKAITHWLLLDLDTPVRPSLLKASSSFSAFPNHVHQ